MRTNQRSAPKSANQMVLSVGVKHLKMRINLHSTLILALSAEKYQKNGAQPWRSALKCYVHIFNFGFFLLSSLVDSFFGLRQKFPIIKLETKMEISGIIRSM